jgi:hypothetical protein
VASAVLDFAYLASVSILQSAINYSKLCIDYIVTITDTSDINATTSCMVSWGGVWAER